MQHKIPNCVASPKGIKPSFATVIVTHSFDNVNRSIGDCATLKLLYRHGADMTVTSQLTGETVLHCVLAQQSQGDEFRCCW